MIKTIVLFLICLHTNLIYYIKNNYLTLLECCFLYYKADSEVTSPFATVNIVKILNIRDML